MNPGGRRHEIIIPQSSFKLKAEHLEPWKPFCSWSKSNHFVEFNSTMMMKPRLLDVHGICVCQFDTDFTKFLMVDMK